MKSLLKLGLVSVLTVYHLIWIVHIATYETRCDQKRTSK